MLLAKEHNALFVCANPKAMEVKSHAYGVAGVQFISYDEFNKMRVRGCQLKNIVIDELECYMKCIYGTNFKLIGYSISEE